MRIFFDGACPVCSREIGFYRRQSGADRIDWVDVSCVGEHDLPDGLSPTMAMAQFHAEDEQGEILAGAAAFAALWLRLPRFHWLGRAASYPAVNRVLEFIYRRFLAVRPFWKRQACKLP